MVVWCLWKEGYGDMLDEMILKADDHSEIFVSVLLKDRAKCYASLHFTNTWEVTMQVTHAIGKVVFLKQTTNISKARFSNQHSGINICCYEMVWRAVFFLYSYHILVDRDSTSKCIYFCLWLSVKGFCWFPSILSSLPLWHLKGVNWLDQFLGFSE